MNNNSGNILKNVHYETKDLKCNYYFFRIKDFNHIEKEHKTNSRKIKEHTPNILQLIKRNGEKLCSGVTKGYILDDLKDSDYILILTSINLPLHNLRDKDFVIDKLCGLVFLKNFAPKDIKKNTEYLYISLICAQRGIGSHLLKKCEEFAEFLEVPKIKLDSLDAPLGFYLKKGFMFDYSSTTRLYKISHDLNDDPIPLKDRKNYRSIQDIKKEGNPLGFILNQKVGKASYNWIVIKDNGTYKYKFIRPGYILTHKRVYEDGNVLYKPVYNKKIMQSIDDLNKGHRGDGFKKTRQKDIHGNPIDTHANMITILKNVSSYRLDNLGVGMTKIL